MPTKDNTKDNTSLVMMPRMPTVQISDLVDKATAGKATPEQFKQYEIELNWVFDGCSKPRATKYILSAQNARIAADSAINACRQQHSQSDWAWVKTIKLLAVLTD